MAQWLRNLTRNHEVVGLIPGLAQWVKGSGGAVSCGVGHRRSSDLALLWLGCRPAATALIQPLAWEPPYATGATLKRTKGQKISKAMFFHSAYFFPENTPLPLYNDMFTLILVAQNTHIRKLF